MGAGRSFADVVVFTSLSEERTFTYRLPEGLRDRVGEGSLVVVPFGARRLYGVVVKMLEVPPIPVDEVLPVESVVDERPVFTPLQLDLARWMAREYLAPLWRCLAAMLPLGIVGKSDVQIELTDEVRSDGEAWTEAQEQLLKVLDARGQLRGRQLDRLLPRRQWRRAAEQLARRGIVVKSPYLAPPRVRSRQVRTVRWTGGDVPEEEALTRLRDDRYPAIVRFLKEEGGPVDVSWVYAETGCTRYHLDKLAERGLVAFDTEEVWRDPLADETFVPDTPPPLTTDQQAVWRRLQPHLGRGERRVFLLHGVTGSGKTEIYLRAVAEVLRRGGQAIVLVPEISLTPQMAHRFGARFGRRIAILHSGLSDGERYDGWRRARTGQVDIVLGPRSALFAPLPRLGLIVVDEEHDAGYKQAATPRYHAREAALELARLAGVTVILGSATPDLGTYLRARRGEITVLEMPRRILAHSRRIRELRSRYRVAGTRYRPPTGGPSAAHYIERPTIHIVDMRAELRAGNRSIFSRALHRAMEEALGKGEQIILFLNRRGSATFVVCRDCGYVPRCPQCDIPLTYHESPPRLVCHRCNYHASPPARCPECGGGRIRYFGLGTERVEQAIHRRWPDVRTLRWDVDTAGNYAAHAAILHLFSTGLAHVLVGTQMIAKGLDLPRVTLVGVVSADTALNLPDFRAGERTFQLLTQVAGRAGRGLLGGRVIVQTYHPDHYAIVAAAAYDYERFAAEELAFRRDQGYPPYRRLTRLLYEDVSQARARSKAEDLAALLRRALADSGRPVDDVIGPAPSFFGRLRGRYRWQILLRHPSPAEFLRTISLPPGWKVDVDPVDVL